MLIAYLVGCTFECKTGCHNKEIEGDYSINVLYQVEIQ